MLLNSFGAAGQERLARSTAVILGCGALGSAAAELLARAGVGHLRIIDRDFVELTNLQRQILFDEDDLAQGLPKAEAARRKLLRINSEIQVEAVVDDINYRNIAQLAADASVLVDGLDNFETRYLVNDLAVRNGIPYIYGGAVATGGMALTILPRSPDQGAAWERASDAGGATPCLRCLFPQAPPAGETPTCDTVGVLGPLVTLIASIEASEALKVLTGNFASVQRQWLNVDLWHNLWHTLDWTSDGPDPACPCCGLRQFDHLQGQHDTRAASLCGRDAVQLSPSEGEGVDLDALAHRLPRDSCLLRNEFLLRFTVQEADHTYEISLFGNGRAIIKGTDDPAMARSLYARYVGS